MRILITGGSGFLGTNLVKALSSGHYGNHELLNLDIAPPVNAEQTPFWSRVDVRHAESLSKRARDYAPEVLIHLGARTDLSDKTGLRGYDANIDGVQNVMAVASSLPNLTSVVYASSRLVFDVGYAPRSTFDYAPSTLYGFSKVLGEVLVRTRDQNDVPWLIVRPTSIWGPWFGVPYRDFFLNVTRGRYVHPRGHRPVKQFGYVGNAVHQILRLSLANDMTALNHEVFWLADYTPLDVLDWANEIRSQLGLSGVREVDLRILRVAARSGDLVQRFTGKSAPLTSFRLNNLVADMVYDTTATEAAVGDLPYSTTEGIKLTLEWMDEAALLPRQRREVPA